MLSGCLSCQMPPPGGPQQQQQQQQAPQAVPGSAEAQLISFDWEPTSCWAWHTCTLSPSLVCPLTLWTLRFSSLKTHMHLPPFTLLWCCGNVNIVIMLQNCFSHCLPLAWVWECKGWHRKREREHQTLDPFTLFLPLLSWYVRSISLLNE